MPGWSRVGRNMSLDFGTHMVNYKVVSEQESKDIGFFVAGFGLLLIMLAISSTIALMDYGRFIAPALPEASKGPAIMLGIFVVIFFAFAPRGGIALAILICAYVQAIDFGQEFLQERTLEPLVWMLAAWFGGVLVSFALLWPYPLWPGLVLAYLFGTLVPFMILGSWVHPGPDGLVVAFTWVVALCIELFGIMLSWLHHTQQDLEGSHYVRYGD